MKLWGLGGETMALLVRKYGSLGFALASQDYGQQTTDLWTVADCSPLSVDCSLPKKPKLRRCRLLLTPVSPRIPPYRGILKGGYLRGGATQVPTSRADFLGGSRLF